ncbi:MAG TPA: hypothetical protein VNG12_01525 [Acidimicrobiales bacterium]|nr:hypothetical protein [Acidimicrobiales bacterium]
MRILNSEVLQSAGINEAELAAVERRERAELERRTSRYRSDRPPVALSGRIAIAVDDGVATGSTARAARRVAQANGAGCVVMAVLVASRSSVSLLADICDEVVCLEAPEPFYAVGGGYQDFSPTSDDEVVALLQRKAPGPRHGSRH